MQNGSKNEGIQDDRNFSGGMLDEMFLAGNYGICSFLTNRMQDSFKIHDRMQMKKGKSQVTNVTWSLTQGIKINILTGTG